LKPIEKKSFYGGGGGIKADKTAEQSPKKQVKIFYLARDVI
jgi:hypothetical protein